MEWIFESASLQDVFNQHRVVIKRFVRCKDCKERDETGWCEHVVMYTEDKFFCAWGERKDDV